MLTALLDEIRVERSNYAVAFGRAIDDETALDVLAAGAAVPGGEQTALVGAGSDGDSQSAAVPAILGLAAGLKALVRGLWSNRGRRPKPGGADGSPEKPVE